MNGLVVFVEGSADGWYVLRALGKLGGADFDSRKPGVLFTGCIDVLFEAPKQYGR